MRFNTEILNMFKSYLADNKPYVKNGAIVGVDSSILKAAYRTTTSAAERSFNTFGTEAEALDFLVG